MLVVTRVNDSGYLVVMGVNARGFLQRDKPVRR
jgi:hypothetical protein